MSIETVLEEISALRNDIKTLSKIIRKVKAKQHPLPPTWYPNRRLRDLLEPPADTQVTFLNLQKYLSPHYSKPEEKA